MNRIELPKGVDHLTTSIEKLGTEALSAGRQLWLAGLGVVATLEEGAVETFDTLVAKGRKSRFAPVAEAEKALATARERVGRLEAKVEKSVESQVGSVLGRLGVPTRREVQELTRRVESLAQSLR